MFLSLPQYEFPVPEGLGAPGAKHWRVVEMTLHMPWFLLTVEQVAGDHDEVRINHTLCIAWETDLADAITTLDTTRVLGLVAMMPAWASPTGQWSSRQITEVWRSSSDDGTSITLTDISGTKFDAASLGGPVPDASNSELLLRLPAAKSRTLRPRRPASGRARRRVESPR